MHTRKQIKTVLNEWKSFLSEAKENTFGPVIRIFDFDGTLTVYKDPEVGLLMKNPYMLSFINPSVSYKLNKKYSTVPSNIKEILADTGPTTKNYVISKISSTGLPKVKADKLILGLKNIELKGDKNFEALAKFVIEPVVPNWKKLIDNNQVDEFMAEARSVLNIDTGEFIDQSRVTSDIMLMNQEDKIEQVLTKYKISDKFARIYTKDNIAKQEEVPLDGGGAKIQAVAGTSGKFSPAHTIATNAFAEFPNSTITFEIYDNSTSNVAEIESGILKASSGETDEEIDEKSEQALLASLKKEIGRQENVAIKKFQAIMVGDEFEIKDLSDVHISKSKGRGTETIQESGPLLKFQKIKNKFFALAKFLKSDGKKTGAPNKKTVGALDVTFEEHPSVGESVKELYKNYVPSLGETGLEPKYTSKTEVNNLSEEMLKFIIDYDSFKQNFLKNKEQGRMPGEAAEVTPAPALEPKAKAKTAPAKPVATEPKEPVASNIPDFKSMTPDQLETWLEGTYDQLDVDDPAKLAYDKWEASKASMRESVRPQKKLLREFKLVLRSKK